MGRANADNGRVVEQPSAAELAVLRCLATGLSRREIGASRYISLITVKTHARELYRSWADAVARAERSVRSTSTNHPGDRRPEPPNSRSSSGMLVPRSDRFATATSANENSDHTPPPSTNDGFCT